METEFNCVSCDVKFSNPQDFIKHHHSVDHIPEKEEKDICCNKCKTPMAKAMWPYHLRTNFHKDNCNKYGYNVC